MSSSDVVIIDEQALESVSDSLKRYIKRYQEELAEAIRQIKIVSDNWNDEDYNKLLSAIISFTVDVRNVEKGAEQLSKRIDTKIAAIRQLRSFKI